MTIYDKTTRDLMHEFAAQTLKPGDVFAKRDPIRWFEKNYPKIKSNTVAMHVEGMSTNSTQRKHHPNIRAGLGWDLFFKLGPQSFRLWDQMRDPPPFYKADLEAGDSLVPEADAGDDEDEPSDVAGESRFAFERDLQNYLVRNLALLEPGLRLYEDEDAQFDGVEFPVGKRYIDILAVGSDGAYVVVETKVSRAYDRVVGQLLRYMAWISVNLAGGKPVRGIVVASDISDDLKLAASLVDNVRLVEYEIAFTLKPHNQANAGAHLRRSRPTTAS